MLGKEVASLDGVENAKMPLKENPGVLCPLAQEIVEGCGRKYTTYLFWSTNVKLCGRVERLLLLKRSVYRSLPVIG